MLIWWRFFELKMRKNMNLLLLFFVLLKKILSYYHEFPLFLNARIRSHFNYLARFVLFLLSGQHFSGKCIFSEIESGLKFPYFHNKKFYMYNYLWMVYHLDFWLKPMVTTKSATNLCARKFISYHGLLENISHSRICLLDFKSFPDFLPQKIVFLL